MPGFPEPTNLNQPSFDPIPVNSFLMPPQYGPTSVEGGITGTVGVTLGGSVGIGPSVCIGFPPGPSLAGGCLGASVGATVGLNAGYFIGWISEPIKFPDRRGQTQTTLTVQSV